MSRPKRSDKLKPKKRKQSPALKRKRAETMKTNARKGRLITLYFNQAYHINGKAYGPGEVKVKKDIADVLREMVSRQAQEQEKFNGSRSCIIGPRGRTGNRRFLMPDGTFRNPSWPILVPEAEIIPKDGG